MSLSDEERKIIIDLEIGKAHRLYQQALLMQASEQWDGMANRLYYALFHAVSALLIHDRHVVNTHKGSHAMLGLHYIKTGKLPKWYGELYQDMERMREESDYNCTYTQEPETLTKHRTSKRNDRDYRKNGLYFRLTHEEAVLQPASMRNECLTVCAMQQALPRRFEHGGL